MQAWRLTGRLDGQSPLLLSSPHSGTAFPAGFRDTLRLPESAVRRMEDSHVGRLLAGIACAPVIEAVLSRAALDLNRAEDEIDPLLFDGPVCARPRVTERVRRGHGLFPSIAGGGHAIHAGRRPAASARRAIERYHRPWHAALSAGMSAALDRHGHAVLLDMHSMPTLDGPRPATIVLGDRHGMSASPFLVEWLQQRFESAGWRVVRNIPYAGGHITERHGRPLMGLHAVQIEMDRALYMNPQTLEPHEGFPLLSAFLAAMARDLLQALPTLDLAPPAALAAE